MSEPIPQRKHYSAWSLLAAARRGHADWAPAWRDAEPRPSYDIIVIGGGGHGLATAYYLAKNHVLELTGRHVDGVLTRLMEAAANPQIGGQSTRARFMDISATIIRIDPNRVFVAVDRPQGLYAFQWIAYVLDTVTEPRLSKL